MNRLPLNPRKYCFCKRKAIDCILKWTDINGEIIHVMCRKHEEEYHPK